MVVDGREEEEREERVCREGLGEVGRKHAGKQQQPHAKLVVPFIFPADQCRAWWGSPLASVAGVPEARDGLRCVETKQFSRCPADS